MRKCFAEIASRWEFCIKLASFMLPPSDYFFWESLMRIAASAHALTASAYSGESLPLMQLLNKIRWCVSSSHADSKKPKTTITGKTMVIVRIIIYISSVRIVKQQAESFSGVIKIKLPILDKSNLRLSNNVTQIKTLQLSI